jgi:hemerythrin-like domain-containing protein
LFDEFEDADSRARKEELIAEAVTELKIHAALEEEIFYPAVRSHIGGEMMSEADEEHHVAKVLIAELDAGGADEEHRDAKFKVLAEGVRHHIKEEESEILPKAKEMRLDFEAMGEKMQARKEKLLQDGVPPDAEHAMILRTGGKADSPAAAAAPKRAKARPKAAAKAQARPKTAAKAKTRSKTTAKAKTRHASH